MVYNTQNYMGFCCCPSSNILNIEKTTLWKVNLFLSLVEEGTPTLLGPLEKANISHSIMFHYVVFRILGNGQSPKMQ
jgi:hypothetical protein